MVALGMSRAWVKKGCCPSYRHVNDGNGANLDAVEIPLSPGEKELLERTRECFVFPCFDGSFDLEAAGVKDFYMWVCVPGLWRALCFYIVVIGW
ncbi:hypothetical protein L1987_15525 [Smallanthus sonchifolius]|uniref:Uncharacterized protein n=1 Tax=Smallanthus sonchifolius TaxID=185202 RepID=A0ACB9J662_9ASTR|nr:hypothetical protein L1987_15525 [Smallanthus sonchifolius]